MMGGKCSDGKPHAAANPWSAATVHLPDQDPNALMALHAGVVVKVHPVHICDRCGCLFVDDDVRELARKAIKR